MTFKLEGRYRDVLLALGEGMRTSLELQKECHLGDPFLCSNTLAILTRLGLITKGYGLTDLGQARLREISYTANPSVGASTREPTLLEKKQNRVPTEFRREPERMELFPP